MGQSLDAADEPEDGLRVSLIPGQRFREVTDSDFAKYGTVISESPGQQLGG